MFLGSSWEWGARANHRHTRIPPIVPYVKINSTCRGKTKPFDVTLEMRKHKQKRLHSSKLPELKPIGLCFSLPVATDGTSQPRRPAACPTPPASRWVWALQQLGSVPALAWEKSGVLTQRGSLFPPSFSLDLSVCCCVSFFSFLFFFNFFFFYLIIFLILDEVAGLCSTSLHEQAAPLRDFTAFKGHRTATMVKCLV